MRTKRAEVGVGEMRVDTGLEPLVCLRYSAKSVERGTHCARCSRSFFCPQELCCARCPEEVQLSMVCSAFT